MTFKEKLQMEHPECVGERFGGGVKACPYHYGYEEKLNCESKESYEKCEACWGREMPNEELVKTVLLPMPPITEPEEEVTEDLYLAGLKIGESTGYNKGLNDAWELVNTICGFTPDERYETFGNYTMVGVLANRTPQEALAKLKAYEDSKIEVGDVVLIYGEEAVVTRIVDGHANIIFGDGVTNNLPVKEIVGDKTGKHIDIESILEQIRGEKKC